MTTDTIVTQPAPGRYSYHRDRDGCHDTFFIEDSDGSLVLAIYFWDEPDTNEAAEAESKAQSLVAALNMPGGWVDHALVIRSALREAK